MADIPIRSEPYMGKVASRYRDRPSLEQECDVCQLFTADSAVVSGTIPTGTCQLVIGRVYNQGWCKYFTRIITDTGAPMIAPARGVAATVVGLLLLLTSCAKPPEPVPVPIGPPPPPPTVVQIPPPIPEPGPLVGTYRHHRYHYYRSHGYRHVYHRPVNLRRHVRPHRTSSQPQ